MTTTDFDMTVEKHIETSLRFLEQSREQLASGDAMQGSETLWLAACDAVRAVATARGLPCGNPEQLHMTVRQLSHATNNKSLSAGFGLAEMFHANSAMGLLEDFQLESDPQLVRRFVHEIISVTQNYPKE